MSSVTARRRLWICVAALLLFGAALRIVPWTAFDGLGYDVSWYRKYLLALDQHGLASYPDVCTAYLMDGQSEATIAKVPPLRALFIVSGFAWKRVAFGSAPPADVNTPGGLASDPALISLHRVATLFGCLALVAAWGLGRRLLGEEEAVAALALFAVSPLLIHMSQHSLVDGVYGCAALFTLWALVECLRAPANARWRVAFTISFALLVTAKENAFFVGLGVGAILVLAPWLGFGRAPRALWVAAVAGGLLGVGLLALAAGGLRDAIDVYRLFIAKAQVLSYAHETGDGPWWRYLVDLMIFTPVTLCLGIGGFLRAATDRPGLRVLLVFLGVTYVAMVSVRYGMNLRYTTIWEFPLRALAVVQLTALVARFARPQVALTIAVALACVLDLTLYHRFFVAHRLYELPTEGLLRAVRMLPPP